MVASGGTAGSRKRGGYMRTLTKGWKFLESLRWHGGRFWAVDAFAGKILSMTETGTVQTHVEIDGAISSMGWLPDGRMVLVAMDESRVLITRGDELIEHADLSKLQRGLLNDMIVDAQGRCYVGTMGFDIQGGAPLAPGVLVRVDPDGTAHIVADDLIFPNGIALKDDGATLVVAETFAQRLTSFSVNESGALAGREVLASFGLAPTTTNLAAYVPTMALGPDGICAGTDGTIWVSDPFGRQIVQVTRGGEIRRRLLLRDGCGAYACAVGGKSGDLIGICAAKSHDRAYIDAHPQNSYLLTVEIAAISTSHSETAGQSKD